ncbi:hypothetical protein [Leeuwenhoekiella blandensis]|uniref:hypothetical protein n=1 Tax=Leeuwenhoekiella blandensis TaxID=360293 RepID=UPI0032B2C083
MTVFIPEELHEFPCSHAACPNAYRELYRVFVRSQLEDFLKQPLEAGGHFDHREKSHTVSLIPSPSPPEASGEKGVSLLCDLS